MIFRNTSVSNAGEFAARPAIGNFSR